MRGSVSMRPSKALASSTSKPKSFSAEWVLSSTLRYDSKDGPSGTYIGFGSRPTATGAAAAKDGPSSRGSVAQPPPRVSIAPAQTAQTVRLIVPTPPVDAPPRRFPPPGPTEKEPVERAVLCQP